MFHVKMPFSVLGFQKRGLKGSTVFKPSSDKKIGPPYICIMDFIKVNLICRFF